MRWARSAARCGHLSGPDTCSGPAGRPSIAAMALPPRWHKHSHNGLVLVQAALRTAILQVCAGFENSLNPRAALAALVARGTEHGAIYEEVARILGTRIQAIPAHQRPHYAPAERLAILTLRARAGWNAARTARIFSLSAGTIATWTRQLREHGAETLLSTPVPVNRFPDYVGIVLRQLKTPFAVLWPPKARRNPGPCWPASLRVHGLPHAPQATDADDDRPSQRRATCRLKRPERGYAARRPRRSLQTTPPPLAC